MTEISEDKLELLDEILTDAKINLLYNKKSNFITTLMSKAKFVWTTALPVAATDGIHLFLNPNFFQKITPRERVFLIGHELWHIALLHPLRMQNKEDKHVFNIAIDHLVNLRLVEDGIEPGEGKLKQYTWLCDDQYADMSAEEIYDILMAEKEQLPEMKADSDDQKEEQDEEETGNDDGGGSQGQEEDEGEEEEKEDSKGDSPSEDESEDQSESSGGDGDETEESSGSGQSDDSGDSGDSSIIDQTPEQILKDLPSGMDVVPVSPDDQKAKEQMEFNVIASKKILEMSNKDCGSIPGDLKLFLDKFDNPRLPWYVFLERHMNSLIDVEYSYRRTRDYCDPIILKSRNSNTGLDIVNFYIDVSASITNEEIMKFVSEIVGIKNSFDPNEIKIISFDTRVRDEYEYSRETAITDIRVTGRGGTRLEDVYRHINESEADVSVIFTDLEVPIPPIPPKTPLIWVVKGNPNTKVPYGTLIEYEDYE